MNHAPYFVRPCPTCSRKTQILLEYLGTQVCCRHCGRQFTASDPDNESAALDDPVQYWINFTDHRMAAAAGYLPEEVNRSPR